MGGPNYGALGMTFSAVRGLQAVSLIAIIGMTANFISQMVSSSTAPPRVLVGTLSVTCVAVLYCALTWILYFDGHLPFLINTALDGLLLIAVVVVAITVGKPLSYLDCEIVGKQSGNVNSAYAYVAALGHNLNKDGSTASNYLYGGWIGATKSTCLEMKSIWGLSIALCILFAFSAICSVCLWRRSKVVPSKSLEG